MAPCPDDVTLDIRALALQKKFGSDISAAQLYASIPVIHPTVTSLVIEIDSEKGDYRFASEQAYEQLPEFGWDHIFRFVQAG